MGKSSPLQNLRVEGRIHTIDIVLMPLNPRTNYIYSNYQQCEAIYSLQQCPIQYSPQLIGRVFFSIGFLEHFYPCRVCIQTLMWLNSLRFNPEVNPYRVIFFNVWEYRAKTKLSKYLTDCTSHPVWANGVLVDMVTRM